MPDNLVLIGFSGTGKSTIARLLAERLGRDRFDTDDAIVAQFGRPVAEVFRDAGEGVFRAAERQKVAEACTLSGAVISLGGGAVVDPASRAFVRDRNIVIRLEATAETIYRRLRAGPGAEVRPMLAGADPLGRIRALKASRADAYAIADIVVDTEDRTPAEVVDEIVRALETRRREGER